MKRLIVALLIFMPMVNADALTRSQIRTEARAHLRDTDTTNPRWSTAVLDTRIDIAELEFIKLARMPIKTSYITTTVNVSTYAMPTDCIAPVRIAYAIFPTTTTLTYKRLEYVTVEGMDNTSKGYSWWEDADADLPTKYMYPETGVIRLYPAPSSSYDGTDLLKVTYAVRVSTMASDSAVPFDSNTFMYPYHNALIWYTCFLCALDTGVQQSADYFLGKFMADVNIAIGQTNDKPDKQGGFAPK